MEIHFYHLTLHCDRSPRQNNELGKINKKQKDCKESSYYGLNCTPLPTPGLHILKPHPQHLRMTVFGGRASEEVIKVKQGYMGSP